jgi:hypothetical protein
LAAEIMVCKAWAKAPSPPAGFHVYLFEHETGDLTSLGLMLTSAPTTECQPKFFLLIIISKFYSLARKPAKEDYSFVKIEVNFSEHNYNSYFKQFPFIVPIMFQKLNMTHQKDREQS